MRALSLHNKQLTYSNDVPPPVPSPGEVLVKVKQAGICETDLQLARGYMQFKGILGHEFVGIAQSGIMQGQRVVGEINCCCRICNRCRAGLGNHCGHRTVLGIDRHDGAFADLIALPEAILHVVRDSVSDDEAVLVEPLAAAFEILEQVDICQTDRIVFCGDGRLALLCAKAVALTGATIHVIGKHVEKLSRFQSMGVETTLWNATQPESLFDIAIDCTGSPSGLPLALQLVRPRGKVILKTTVAADYTLSLAKIVIDEITVIGSRCGPFDKAIEALAGQRVDLSGFITHRFPIESSLQAMEFAKCPEAFKVVLKL